MVWPECLDFEENSYSQLAGSLSPDYKNFHARQISQQPSFSSQTVPDCINILPVAFAITLNDRKIFLLHINTLACVKAEIEPMLRILHFSYIVQNR